jgi:mannosylglycerate hydrolase
MKQVHIVPHVHWDREWYFTAEESRILLVNNMEEVLDMLENKPEYHWYILDGQTAILEDYFAVKPAYKERVKNLVQAGRLIIGPWYTQTDLMVVGGESVVRNLLYGMKDCAEFGEAMKIGYLPDSFGQSSQLPQILNGFGIHRAIFWRGVSERHGTDKTEFYWKSDNGDKVLVQVFPLGYAIGKYLPEDETKLKERMDKYFTVLDKGATTEHIIVPNGHDQMPIQKNILQIIDKLKGLYLDRQFFLSRYENVFAELEKQVGLAEIQGEFLDGKYMRVHRSIYSTRMDIKAANTRIENKLTNVLEPLGTIAYSLGFEYHNGLIELIWKLIMKNHAHDSMACCCSDEVHREILARFWTAEEKVDRLIDFYMRKLADAMPTNMGPEKLALYNLLPYEREEVIETSVVTKFKNFALVDDTGKKLDFQVTKKEIVDPGLIDRQIVHYANYDPFVRYVIQFKDVVPAMGYKAYSIIEADDISEAEMKKVNQIETDFYIITVNTNGTLRIYDKKLDRVFDNVLMMEDIADDGDEYDFSPMPGDVPLLNDKVTADFTLRQTQYFAYLEIKYEMYVAKDMESRRRNVCDVPMTVELSLTISVDKPVIDVEIKINNTAKDHRVRTQIPTGLQAAFSTADNQFGHIQRSVTDPAMEVWEKEGWDERPDSIYPMLSYVGLANEEYGIAILTNSTREYEIVGEKFNAIAITLFRSVGCLGKEELLRRPGRPSGIKLETPDSQMLGTIALRFAILTHRGTTLSANVARWAKWYLTPVYYYNKKSHDAMKLNQVDFHIPPSYSLLTQTDKDIVLSALKKSEKDQGIILRIFNPADGARLAQFAFGTAVKEIAKTNLHENVIVENIAMGDGSRKLELDIKKNEVQTVLLQR